MSKFITVSRDEIVHYAKLFCQIPTLIEGIVTCKIVASAAAEAGIEVEPEELQQAADNLRQDNNLHQASNTQLWLRKHHLSVDNFEELVYTNTISEKLAKHLFADKVDPFFYKHQLDYTGVVMYEVVLNDEDFAMKLFYALQEGEVSFHDVARQYIQEPTLRCSGGYLGILRRKELIPETSTSVFASTPPQILKPIVTSKGAHLILVEEIIQPQLDEQLRSQILSDLFSAWLKQQIEQVKIAVNLEPRNKVA